MIYSVVTWMITNFLGIIVTVFVGGMAYGDYLQIIAGPVLPSERHLARAYVRLWVLAFVAFCLNFLAAGDVYFQILPQPERSVVDVAALVGATVVLVAAFTLHHLSRLKSTYLARKERQSRQE